MRAGETYGTGSKRRERLLADDVQAMADGYALTVEEAAASVGVGVSAIQQAIAANRGEMSAPGAA